MIAAYATRRDAVGWASHMGVWAGVVIIALWGVNLYHDTTYKIARSSEFKTAKALREAPYSRFIDIKEATQLRTTPLGGIPPDFYVTLNVKEVPEGGIEMQLKPVMSCDFKPFDDRHQLTEHAVLKSVTRWYNEPKVDQWVPILPVTPDGREVRYPEREANCHLDLHGDLIIYGTLPKGFDVIGKAAKVRYW